MTRAIAFWVVVLAVAPGVARASDVSVAVACDKYGTCQGEMVLTAGRGEQNDLTVTQVNSATLVDSLRAPAFGFAISDRKAPLHAGSGCMSVDLYSASCSFSADTARLSVSLGDGNHRLDARAVTAPVQVTTGHGNNVLLTGSGNDTFAPGAGRNILDGGDGENTVDFVQSAQPVRVDLQSSAPSGTTTSQNILRRIQDVQATGSPHDVLLGSNGPNALYAGRYSYVNGRGGNDRLFGGPGSIIIAGGGRDELSGNQDHPGTPGRTFRCGSGLDTVEASLLDLVSPNCALVKIDQGSTDRFVRLESTPAPNRPFVALRYGCYFPPSCSIVIAARLGSVHGTLLARRVLHVRFREDGVVEHDYGLTLAPDGYARLRRYHRLRVVVYEQLAPTRGYPGYTSPAGFTMSLRG